MRSHCHQRAVGPSLLLLCCGLVIAQQDPAKAQNPQAAEQPAVFRSQVNTVLVPVVVRDTHGRAVGHLTKDDFELLDKGHRQTIASFSAIERPKLSRGESGARTGNASAPTAPLSSSGVTRSESENEDSRRYFIYLFDDVHTRFADLATVRAAALRHFQNSLRTDDRAAIYTVSGNPTLEFTDNREQLEAAVSQLRWRTTTGHGMGCPDVSYYVADLILVKGDPQALAALTNHTANCAHARPEVARNIALDAANKVILSGAEDSLLALRTVRRAIRRLAVMPGQRVIVLASPGFFSQTPEAIRATAEVLDLAAKSGVIINGLSSRGVILVEEEENVTGPSGSSRRSPPKLTTPDQLWVRYRREGARAEGDVLQDLAEGTGGIFFHNNNDLRAGFERAAAAPEFSYVLGFSPADLDQDGSFHALRIRLPNRKGISVEARRGYYALSSSAKDHETAADIEDAVFSRDQLAGMPVVLVTSSSKPNNSDEAKLLVVAKIEIAALKHSRVGGRSLGSLSVVIALFDSEGGYVTGATESVNPKPSTQTVQQQDAPLTLRWEFPGIKSGSYLLRFVIRESETNATTSINRSLQIL